MRKQFGGPPKFLEPLRGKVRRLKYAVYDLETLVPENERVYLVGFYDGKTYRYFESEPMWPEEHGSAVDQFLRWLFSSWNYNDYWIYGHNAGNFDALFILKWFLSYPDDYRLELTPLQSSILAIQVYERGKSKEPKSVLFLDSFRLMNASLDKLLKAFGLGGKVSGIDYKTLHTDARRYAYLETDCRGLYDCLTQFVSMVRRAGGDIGWTAPGTAMASFRRGSLAGKVPTNRHYPNCKSLSCDGCLHEFVRRAYYGGRVEVFRESFQPRMAQTDASNTAKRISLGDVNSMYPAAMLGDMPCELAAVKDGEPDFQRRIKHYLGFCEVDIEQPKTYLPVLPVRDDGKLLFPTGRLRGVWSSIEIAAAIGAGAKVAKWGRSIWFRGKPIFKNFVTHWYSFRDRSKAGYDPAMDALAKLMLNSLYGKMGMNETREKLWFFPTETEFDEHDLTPIADVIDGAYTELVKVTPAYVIPHIAAWVTASARLTLWKILNGFVKNGHKIWYCDTDSVVTDATISSSSRLGGLKLECGIISARFVAPKMYWIREAPSLDAQSGNERVKAKGFSGGFGAKGLSIELFNEVVDKRARVRTERMTKFREGLRSKTRFPGMKVVMKGVHAGLLDEKRIHIGNGDTRPREVNQW